MQTNMRLADFIRAEIEVILQDWEAFAKTISNSRKMGKIGLRDHARDMLLVIADDLDSTESSLEQSKKSRGKGAGHTGDSWAEIHGGERHTSGFSILETVSEFRALRASVISRWTKAYPTVTLEQLEDHTRFHEAIDQAVAESLEQYTLEKDMETRLFEAILVASPDPIHVLDLEGRFVYANEATTDLFALDSEAIIGHSNFDLGFSYASDFQRNLDKVITEQCTFRGKFTHTFESGQGDRFEYLLAPVLNEEKKTEATVCIFRDVTEQAIAEERIWHNAHHDLLTGLPNRRLFLDRLEQETKHANRSTLPLAVLFMDLDGFKEVNDALGHEAGDHLLADVSERLTGYVREDDTVARMGGDEFTLILTRLEQREDVEGVAHAIIDAVAMPFHIARQRIQISVSVGIAFYPQDASDPVTLLEAADQAMYAAKRAGSNQMCFYDALAKSKTLASTRLGNAQTRN